MRAVPTAGVEEAKTEYTAAATAVTSNTKSRAAFESQSSDRIAESDVAEETMSTMVKFAKDPLEHPGNDQPTAECHLMAWPFERDELRPHRWSRRHRGACLDVEERGLRSHFRGGRT